VSSVQYLIGKTLGKYTILDHIGHGGMSEVYKGQQAQLNRMVAIKVLHPFLADEEGFVVRFQREARIVANLRHRHIVQVFDFDYNEALGIYYMVMEYIDGPTLKDLLEDGPISPEETVRIGAAIADALDYAHGHSMVHRDIKPANIMFLDTIEPVLTDFGIAKMLTLSGLTASGAMVGTPAYMAPEIGIGKAGTASSDIYSLGVVLYQAMSGSLPFSADTPMGMVMQHINNTPPPPSRYKPGLPPALERVILRALEKEPAGRFARARDMAMALQQALSPVNGAGAFGPADAPLTAERAAAPIDAPDGAPAEVAPEPDGQGLEAVSEWLHTAPSRGNKAVTSAPVPEGDPLADERLVRSWSPLSHRAMDATTEVQDEEPAPGPHDHASRGAVRWFWRAVLALIVIAAAVVAWSGPARIQALLASLQPVRPTAIVPTATLRPAATATVPSGGNLISAAAASATPQLTATASPSPTPASPCAVRVRLDNVRVEPAQIVAPGTPLVAYITLRNSGSCPWSSDAGLYYREGVQMGARAIFPIGALAAGETVQVVIPMSAPEELGSYQSVWWMREASGRDFGSRIVVEITVDDVPTSTPVLVTLEPVETRAPEPLALHEPQMVSWQDDPGEGRWSATVVFEATGGNGSYRIYQGKIGEGTELIENRLAFTWRRCEAFPVQLLILSGLETLNWSGEIPYPAPERCQ